MMNNKLFGCIIFPLFCAVLPCHAFILGGTRVILSQDAGSVSLPVISSKADPLYLIHSKITKNLHDEVSVDRNFMITPVLFRLDTAKRSQIRISLMNQQGLPTDRESLFYLKVAGIPSSNPLERNSATGFVGGSLLVGTGSIIKLLYRPHGIERPGEKAWHSLQFTRLPEGIQVTNPTPWNVSFASLYVDDSNVKFSSSHSPIIPPFSKQIYETKSHLKKNVKWSVLDDNGNPVDGISAIG